ncbi:hypothetical protein JCM10450v2_006866 [Rhodotorula kratochvilovae]
MRLPLQPAPSLLSQLASPPSPTDPPLLFIGNEPFLVELQGSLEGPTGEECAGEEASKAAAAMEGVRVGKVDLSDPKKPVLRIAHHRLEGKLETLLTPYALLRTTRTAPSPSSSSFEAPPAKRPRVAPRAGDEAGTRVEIAALIRRKLVFSKRPEPLVEVSSEADPLFAEKKRAALAGRPKAAASAAAGGKGGGGGGGFFAPKGGAVKGATGAVPGKAGAGVGKAGAGAGASGKAKAVLRKKP